ncbi:MAG TPA: DNA polymerase domain-containing protein [Bacteroidota bacterium]|nr:DNA polymerase domain-containing protein [Bacteroidota bacterium]
MNPALFGHAQDPRIVAAHQAGDGAMRVYVRDGEGVTTEDRPFFPFFFLSEPRLIEGFRRKHWVRRLDGSGAYNHLCVFEEWPAMWDGVRYILDAYNRHAVEKVEAYQDLDIIHLLSDPVTQYLHQTGRTLFKELTFADLRRLQLDIETYTTAGHRFSNSSRPGDRIILVALSDSTGWEHVIDGRKHSEQKMLEELVRTIRERDPDVIEGHNIFNFDIPYILARCALHGVTPSFGRDGSVPRSFDSRTSFAEHAFEYTVTDIAGRHIIDTLLLVQNYDAVRRNMESYGLKYAAQYFGLSPADRTYVPGEKISWYWDNEPATLVAYALDDVRETGLLSAHLSGSAFYLTQMLPYAYGAVARMGAASKIESLLVREYLRQKHAIPRPREGTQTTGGYTDIFLTGVLGPVVHADVESLYPSIMLGNAIAPAADDLGVFLGLLRDLTALRLETKRAMQREADPVSRSRLDAMQSSFKILINSFYGYLGYNRALFNDHGKADEVTKTGQKILRSMITEIRAEGGKVVEVDTDGIFFVPPVGVDTDAQESAFVADLSAKLPEGITVALNGRYRKILSYKMKNYALLEYDNKIRIKGSSLVSRSMEQFGRTFVHHCIDFILQGNFDGLHRLYVQYYNAILGHGLEVRDFARVEALRDPIAVYEEEVNAGRRNRSAAYTVAIASGRPVRQGDRIAYYITGNDPNPRATENCKAAEEWDPNFPDENSQYYIRRLNEFSEKFMVFFQPKDFRAIFSADDLFPFDPSSVTLLITDVVAENPSDDDEPRPGTFGIWLEG